MYGVDGDTGKMVDMKEYGLLESASVKIQTLKTAIEVSFHLLYPSICDLHPSHIPSISYPPFPFQLYLQSPHIPVLSSISCLLPFPIFHLLSSSVSYPILIHLLFPPISIY
jgi:hypothetical protein